MELWFVVGSASLHNRACDGIITDAIEVNTSTKWKDFTGLKVQVKMKNTPATFHQY